MEINHFFESGLQWSFDNGVIYINGRDIVGIMIGFTAGIIFAYIIRLVEVLEEEKKDAKRRNDN